MASQQILFAETIAGMKKAFKRKPYESDSDSEIENHGNRGGKLKKRARFAHQGQLVPTQGLSAYTETVDYAGVRRTIIHRNPPLLDDEGYEMDSEEDADRIEDAELAAAELNPYANVRLEHVLAPLTALTDLPTHPTLSKHFVSKNLTDLVSQSCDLMRKENRSLWRIRHLWTALCGDGTWMPCELMMGPNDLELYTDDHVARHLLSLAKASGGGASSLGTLNGETHSDQLDGANRAPANAGDKPQRREGSQGGPDVATADAGLADKADGETGPRVTATTKEADGDKSYEARHEPKYGGQAADDAADDAADQPGGGGEGRPAKDKPRGGHVAMKDVEATTSRPSDKDPSVASEGMEQTLIHPMFLTPAGAKPDRDVGLPRHEAVDIRRLVALYVQKQDEVCRGAKKLHHGLLKAERLRREVLHWAKAEAHCGPNRDMSDGEDWYDKEEWGLTEDLKKGQDEEEEDTATTGKKTRTRR